MVTSGKAWRKAREEGIECRFPDGDVARIRPVEIDMFVLSGRPIPSLLAPMMLSYINGEIIGIPQVPPSELVEKSIDFLMFLNDLATFAFVEPRIVERSESELGDDEITIEDVSYEKKLFLYRAVFGRPAVRLRPFLDKINAMATVVPKSDNGDTTVEAAAD